MQQEPTVVAAKRPAHSTKRIRRTAEEARRLILDAAEKRLAEQGPEGIRLQDIAKDVGVSHPAILHHFESRDGLVRALIKRATSQLRDRLLSTMPLRDKNSRVTEDSTWELLEGAFEALSDKGTARLLAWLLLTGKAPVRSENPAANLLDEVSQQLHQRRISHRAAAVKKNPGLENTPEIKSEDSYFMAMLVANAAIGEAIMGNDFYAAAGMTDADDTKERFRRWLAKLMNQHALQIDRGET